MKKTNTVLVIAATLVGILLFSNSQAFAQKIVMNVAWATPLDSDYGILAKKFKELFEAYTGNKIEVRMHCCGQLGNEDDAFKSLQLGVVDAYIITQNNVAPSFPLFDLLSLPYIFKSFDHMVQVLDGPIGDEIGKKLQQQTGVYPLTYGGVTYRDHYNIKRPIKQFSDFGGMKYRVPKNEVMIDTYRAFGAEAVPMAWSETAAALQTGTIDGSDNGTSVIRDMKFYEFAKHLTILEHFMSVSPLFCSERFMSKLNAEQQKALFKSAREAGLHQREVMLKEVDEIRNFLGSKGMMISKPDKKPFIEASLKVQDQFAEKKGPEFKAMMSRIRDAAK
jgi:tripartite ATP-independent transporter DctP family solute receptor